MRRTRLPARKRWAWVGPVGLLISAGFLYLALRHIPFARTWRELQAVNPALLVAAMGLMVASNLLRAWRWQVLLAGMPAVRYRAVFASMMLGYLIDNLLPARVGEVVRVYLLERTTDADFAETAGTVVVERVMEALVLIAAALGLSLLIPLPPAVRTGLRIAAPSILGVALLVFLLVRWGRPVMHWMLRHIARLSARRRAQLDLVIDEFLKGLSVIGSRGRAAAVIVLSLLIWGLEGVTVDVVARSLHLSLPWIGSFFLMTILGISFAIPAAPGGAGTYEYFALIALQPFGLGAGLAVGLAIVLHALLYVMTTAMGIVSIWLESLSFQDLLPGPHHYHGRGPDAAP